jgi:hypothetical protein
MMLSLLSAPPVQNARLSGSSRIRERCQLMRGRSFHIIKSGADILRNAAKRNPAGASPP